MLNRTTEARERTIHANVFEQLQLEELAYLSDKTTSKTSATLIEYLQSKSIIGNEIGEDTGKYQVNVTALLGSKQSLGNGDATVELKDVYMLEKQSTSTGSIVNTKFATITPIKIAATSTTQITYKVMYYENGTSQNLTLGSLTDGNTSSSPVVASGDLGVLKTFYMGNMEDDVGGSQTIDGIYARWLYSIDDGVDTWWEYILYNNNIYKVTCNYDVVENHAEDVTDVSPVEVDLSRFGEREIETGFKILVTPIIGDNTVLIHAEYEGPDTYYKYNETTGEYDIPFTGYCAWDDDRYSRYYDTSGALVRVKAPEPE